MVKNQLPVPSEYSEQLAVVQYLELRGIPFSSIPNSTYTPSMKQKVQNKRMGLRPGLPDLLCVIPGRGLLFIEMKKTKGGVVSEYQKQWIELLNGVPNVEAVVARGAAEAIAAIESIVPLPRMDALPKTIHTLDPF